MAAPPPDERWKQPLPASSSSPARPARSRMRDPGYSEDTEPSQRRRAGASSEVQSFADPFAFDRTQRSQMRSQASVSDTVQKSTIAPSDKLRNAVGAFMTAARTAEPQRPTKNRARQAKREPWEFADEDSKYGEIDGVLRKIQQTWPFVLESDFSPSTLALSLLAETDGTARSPLRAFLKVHDELSMALQSAVQSHFQTFAASLPSHSAFLSTLIRAQEQAKNSKIALREAREGFAGRGKSELASIKSREKTVRDMLSLLDVVDALRLIPDQLESLVGEKRYLEAARLLMKNVKTSRRKDLLDIGALSDLRVYFASQETTLAEIAVEELQNHLYLKGFTSESRWHAYGDGLSVDGHNDRDFFAAYVRSIAMKTQMEVESHSLKSLAGDSAFEADLESFDAMGSLLETLSVLGKLESSIETIVQRAPGELHNLVDTTLEEVEERAQHRHEQSAVRSASHITSRPRNSDFRSSLDGLARQQDIVTLRDLFWTLYSKMNAVLEGYRVAYEVCRWIAARREVQSETRTSTSDVPVRDLWRPLHQEVQKLLESYLSDAVTGSDSTQPSTAVNDVLRVGLNRDRQKSLFKFTDTDSRMVSKDARVIDNNLQEALKSFAPGLINIQVSGDLNAELEDGFATRVTHRRLVPANPFNVSTLFQPTLSFIERACAAVPPEFDEEPRSIGGILEEFVIKVFLPRLDEQVSMAFQNAISGTDSLEVDDTSVERPPQRSSVRVLALIHNLCDLLDSTPFHRENYSRLIVGVIVQFYQECSTQFKDIVQLVGRGLEQMALPALWAQREEVTTCLTEIRAAKSFALEGPLQRELKIENELLGNDVITENRLIGSTRKFEDLCSLAQSLRWFMEALLDLQESTPRGSARLPLTQAMSQRFDAIILTYEQLTEMVMNACRIELRGRVRCNLGAFLRKGEFWLESEALEPDPDVTDLCKCLVRCVEITGKTLEPSDAEFAVRGLGQLANHLFIASAGSIGVVNPAGVSKIQRNIKALQQTLRSSVETGDACLLTRSWEYWTLYERGPKAMMNELRKSKPLYTFEDYKNMLELQCRTELEEAPSAALNSYLIDLHALSMEVHEW
ncbi:Sec8 exocyst complex component-specific domain-domain-containing protein [Kockovaella imperatae]|uniref:Exocyst complex component Sec8 n=1 Tax=Kockovaella imperatae TaxID=4999 RepID=A0A1Y1UFZ8_9TREE|nr:Sec8 exocyst complex component-specific domain-domain-containing protein [Kockovaella imperatae]ORX36436.1 Sec8 exocyst complex component-specific domain-domain-containing protein [Kockovaella imperatae]